MNTTIAGAMAFVLILAMLIAGTTKKAIADEEATKDIFKKLQRASVYVEVEKAGDKTRVIQGSGVVIEKAPSGALRILTCAHLFEPPADPTKVVTVSAPADGDPNNWKQAKAVVTKIDGPRDLALITVMEPFDRDALQVALVQPENFSTVYIYGHPSDAAGTAATGILSRKGVAVSTRKGSLFYQITGFSYHGSSGGAVADQWGRVIGIVSMLGADGNTLLLNVTKAVDLKSIRDFLKP